MEGDKGSNPDSCGFFFGGAVRPLTEELTLREAVQSLMINEKKYKTPDEYIGCVVIQV